MSVSALNAISAIRVAEQEFVFVNASGTALEINPGDYVAYSGQHAIAVNTAIAYWKASGIGIALDRNPTIDWAGRQVANSALLVATCGIFRVSAAFSGQPLLGTIVNPIMTGSGVNAPSGATGLGATWNTAAPVALSACTAAPAGGVLGVAQVIGWFNSGPGGTGQLDVRLWSRNADVY